MVLIKFIKKVKGEGFDIDHRVPVSRLLRLFGLKVLGLIFGVLRFRKLGFIFIHPSTTIYSKNCITINGLVDISKGCVLDALGNDGIYFGENVSVHPYCTLECTGSFRELGKGIRLGNNVGIGRNCHLGGAGGIEIGNDTIIGQYVSFHSENHNYDDLVVPIRHQGVVRKGIKIGSNCWIGAKSTILDGVVLGDVCIVAAGAVLIEGRYEHNGIYGGVPAKLIKYR